MDMKRIKYTLLAFLAILTIKVYGDIIPEYYYPSVKICVKIENLEDYPDIAIIGLSDCVAIFFKPKANTVDTNSCLEVQKACPLTFYAVKKDYLREKGIENINWKKDKNVRKSDVTVIAKKTRVSSGTEALEMNFAIAGFDENSMVMYQVSETRKYNNGWPDSIRKIYTPMDSPEAYQDLLKLQKSF